MSEIRTGGGGFTTEFSADIIGKYVDSETGAERIVTVSSIQERQVIALEKIANALAAIASKER
jgi:hypothetical protein